MAGGKIKAPSAANARLIAAVRLVIGGRRGIAAGMNTAPIAPYPRAPQALPEAVTRELKQLAQSLSSSPVRQDALEADLKKHLPADADYGLQVLRDGVEIVGRAAMFRETRYCYAGGCRVGSCDRADALQLIYSAARGVSAEDARKAVTHARTINFQQVLSCLMEDGCWTMGGAAALWGIAAGAKVGIAAGSQLTAAAWHAGGVAGKAKAIGWGVATGGVGWVAAVAANGVVHAVKSGLENNAPRRHQIIGNELGRDLLLVDAIMGRTYRPIPNTSWVARLERDPNAQIHYLGGHGW